MNKTQIYNRLKTVLEIDTLDPELNINLTKGQIEALAEIITNEIIRIKEIEKDE